MEQSLNRSAAERTFSLKHIFWILVAVTPLLFLDGWGVSYASPKFWMVGIVTILALTRANCFPQGWFFTASFLGLGTYGALSLVHTINISLAFQAFILTAALTVLPQFIAAGNISSGGKTSEVLTYDTFCQVLLPAITISVIGALAFMLSRTVLFLTESPFGSTIGLRNSLPIFLSQTLPLLLYLVSLYSKKIGTHDADRKFFDLRYLLLFLLLAIDLWVVLAYRTRSAWVTLIFYGLFFAGMSLPKKSEVRHALYAYVAALLVSLALVNCVPTKLRWRSPAPYLDSLGTIGSLAHSNGRNLLWKVAAKMVAEKPLLGVGMGQYPAVWRSFISHTQVNPRSFGFLRGDLPLFNDFFQSMVESGLPLALIFFSWIGGIPLLYVVTVWLKKLPLDAPGVTAAAVCLGTCVNALFDSPFQRPETVLVFSLSLGFLIRDLRVLFSIPKLQKPKMQPSLHLVWSSAALLCLTLTIPLTLMTIGLSAKLYWNYSGSKTALHLAENTWSSDISWNHLHTLALSQQSGFYISSNCRRIRHGCLAIQPRKFFNGGTGT